LNWLSDGSAIGFSGNATKETPGWHEDINPYMMFLFKLDSGEWRTWELDVPWSRTAWRKDGNAFYYGVNGGESNSHKPGIIEKELETDAERYIYQMENGSKGVFRSLRCSHDYTKMAFYQGYGNRIDVIDIKSGETLRKFPGYRSSAWSPDGKFIMAKRGLAGLHVLSLADGNKKQYDLSKYLPQGGIGFFDWSPDGNQVVFTFMLRKFSTHLIRDVIPADK
jgi:Tol biopolymer transport system component